jgi:hypothetical protein
MRVRQCRAAGHGSSSLAAPGFAHADFVIVLSAAKDSAVDVAVRGGPTRQPFQDDGNFRHTPYRRYRLACDAQAAAASSGTGFPPAERSAAASGLVLCTTHGG